jgi:hypothetical protein
MAPAPSTPQRALAACAAALGLGLLSPPAAAAGKLGKDGAPIETSEYTIDLYEGPVLAGARVIGLGGAYAPIAEGIAGYGFNPAAAAQRVPWSTSWFDWELDAGVTLPSSITGTDFDNNGDEGFTNKAAIFLTGGVGLQFGDVGVGLTADINQYKVSSREGGDDGVLNVNFARVLLVGAYSFLDGELLAGLGVSFHNVNIERPAAESETGQAQAIAGVYGAAFHGGALWAPAWLPLRVGASVRYSLPASATSDSTPSGVEPDGNGDYVSEGYYLPRTISLPTEIQGGVALQLFRPMNIPWVNPHDEETATRRAQRDAAAAKERREAEAERRLDAARAAGKDEDEVERQIDQEEERAEERERVLLASARQADRIRRKVPYQRMPREKLLVSAAVKVTTRTTNGVGLESFLRQRVARSGTELSFSPRVGVEGEAIPGYLVLRAGSYYEPTRFLTSHARVHGTGGLDVHIPIAWSVFGLLDRDASFRVGGAVDGASRYFGWSVTAGLWH